MPQDAASHVDLPGSFLEVPYAGVVCGGGSVDLLRLDALVRLPDVGDVEHREDEALLIAQRDPGARLDPFGELALHVECHRNGPELAAGKPHRFQDLRPGLPIHEAVEGREAAVHHQLEVAELPLRERQRQHVERFALQRLRLRLADEEGLQRCTGRLGLHGLAHGSGSDGCTNRTYWIPASDGTGAALPGERRRVSGEEDSGPSAWAGVDPGRAGTGTNSSGPARLARRACLLYPRPAGPWSRGERGFESTW